MKHFTMALALLVAGTGGMAACVDREEGMEEAEAPEDALMEDTLATDAREAGQEDGALTVVLEEWTIRPARDTIDAGPTSFRVRNNGSHPHILEVEGAGQEWVTDTIPPGDWADLEIDLAAGTYELYCPIESDEGSHQDLGMETPLVVR